MKLIWRGNWKKGEITLEADDVEQLIEGLKRLESVESVTSPSESTDKGQLSATRQASSLEKPQIAGNLGPSQAIRQTLGSAWGKAEPRTMKEIMEVLEASAIYFSKGTLSGVLANMTKKGELRRPLKKDDQWAYTLTS